ncbi:MAG: FecR family protein [Pedobacter sp.]|nr:MAG: FecR family protein [Pedobacter sp.]
MNYNLYHAEDFAADESFIAYCNQTDLEAIAFWKDWIAHHPEKLDEIYNAEQLLAILSFRLDEQELQDEFSRFDSFLAQDNVPIFGLETTTKRPFSYKKWALVAIVFSIFSFGGYQLYDSQFNKIEYLTLHNGNGKISEFMLSDGTKISLNANSTLKYPKVFNGEKRDVELDGEAFFEVAKDKTKPFSVIANGIKTTVLGTKFNVSSYKNTAKIKVALVEGKVEVQTLGGRDKMILKPAEMATFTIETGALTRSDFNARTVSLWKTGAVVFESASFDDIAAKLNNIYGVELINHTKGLKWNYSGQFENTDYLSIIKSICFAKRINYKQTNQTIILTN